MDWDTSVSAIFTTTETIGSTLPNPDGLKKLGVENVGVFVTRGVLIDVAGYKGVEHLEGGYEITVEDLEGALKKTRCGDNAPAMWSSLILVGVNSGWTDNERYNGSEPGIGMDAGKYFG